MFNEHIFSLIIQYARSRMKFLDKNVPPNSQTVAIAVSRLLRSRAVAAPLCCLRTDYDRAPRVRAKEFSPWSLLGALGDRVRRYVP